MKRTINTPHDVVQVLINTILAHESKIDIFTEYISYQNIIKVTLNTISYLYICCYEMTGQKVVISRYKKKYSSQTKVLEAYTFKVHGNLTDFISKVYGTEKIKIINL